MPSPPPPLRRPGRPPSTRSPRQRLDAALTSAATLHPDAPPERRPVVVRAADLATVLADCPDAAQQAKTA